MPRNKRLTRADLSLLLKAKTRRVNGQYFTLSVLPRLEEKGSKVTCVVSKKVARRAVDRNTIKRRAREAMRPILEQITTPAFFMLYAKREALGAISQEITQDVKKLLKDF